MSEFLFSNFGQTELSADAAQVDTVLRVAPSGTIRMPQPGADQVFSLVITDGKNEPEIAWCSLNPRDGNLTVLRGQEGTPASFWRVGSQVIAMPSAAAYEWFVTGGQILWKDDFQAQLDALTTALAAANARIDSTNTDVADNLTSLTSAIENNAASITDNWSATTDFFYAQAAINTTLTASVSSTQANIDDLASVVASNESAQATINTNVNAHFGTNDAEISANTTAISSNYSAQASMIAALTATLGTTNATVTVKAIALADLTGDVSGAWMVDVSGGDSFAGFRIVAGVSAGTVVSYAKFTVAKFYIDSAAGTVNPFYYDSGTATLSLQNLSVHGDLVVDGTIFTNKVANYTLLNINIARDNLTIGASFEVDPVTGLTSSFVNYATFSFTPAGGRVRLSFQILCINNDSSNDAGIEVIIDVGGGAIRSYSQKIPTSWGQTLFFSCNAYVTPGAGNNTEVFVRYNPSGGGSSNITLQQILCDIDDFNTES